MLGEVFKEYGGENYMEDVQWNDVKKIILNICHNQTVEIDFDTKIMEDLEYDSLDVMELLEQIEGEFGVDFTDLENFEERFNRCGDLYEGILQLVEKNRYKA